MKQSRVNKPKNISENKEDEEDSELVRVAYATWQAYGTLVLVQFSVTKFMRFGTGFAHAMFHDHAKFANLASFV